MAIEMSGEVNKEKKIDKLLQNANFTKVGHKLHKRDSIYVHNSWKSPVFGDDQIPKLISWPQ